MRQTINGVVQRFLCRDCGFRFSEKSNIQFKMSSGHQLCAIFNEAKKLDTTTETKTVAGENRLPQEARGLIAKFMAYLEREGYYQDTSYLQLIRQLAKEGANLLDPEHVKAKIAKHKWKDSVKMLATYAYNAFCKMEKIQWEPPRYKQRDSEIYVPDETDLDQLIASTHSEWQLFYNV